MTMKLSDKLSRIDEDLTINLVDNGYVVTAQGRDSEDDWATAKIICNSMDEVVELLNEAAAMERS